MNSGRNRHFPATVVGRFSSSHEIAHDQWSCGDYERDETDLFSRSTREPANHVHEQCRGGRGKPLKGCIDDRVEKQQLSHLSVKTSIISDLSIFKLIFLDVFRLHY